MVMPCALTGSLTSHLAPGPTASSGSFGRHPPNTPGVRPRQAPSSVFASVHDLLSPACARPRSQRLCRRPLPGSEPRDDASFSCRPPVARGETSNTTEATFDLVHHFLIAK